MLGGLVARVEERLVTRFRTQKTAALLAYLAYHLHRSHPREVLTEMLWPEDSPSAGRRSLTTALSSLRRQLEPPGTAAGTILVADRFAIGLNARTVTTDVREFEEALAAHGGQILCSQACAELLKVTLPAELRLADLGSYRLYKVAAPERLSCVEHPGVGAAGHSATPPVPRAATRGSRPAKSAAAQA